MVRAWERYLNQNGPAPKRPVVAEVALCADRYARGGTEVLTIGVLPVPTLDVTKPHELFAAGHVLRKIVPSDPVRR